MKKLTITAIALAFLASCGNANNDQPATATEASAEHDHQGHDHNHDHAGIAAAGDIIDPVCGMVKDSTWTDYSLYKGDTVWFCAAPEKVAFDANPEKYSQNIKH